MRRARPDWPPTWLTDRPIAHRGLHRRSTGLVENSLSAAEAAIERGFAIECDVQCTADAEAVVFHDFTLDRLTERSGPVAELPSRRVIDLKLRGSDDRVPLLAAFLDRVAGRVPLVCEIKSSFGGDLRLADRVVELVREYRGPFAIKSFDPAIIVHLRGLGLDRPLGIVSQAAFDDPEWRYLSDPQRRSLANLLHFAETRPDFLSYHVDDLPHAAPYLCRAALGLPVMTWTVRTPEQRHHAAAWADQMVFEGFIP